MINQEKYDLYDLNEALKVENLTLNDYEEICKRLKRKPNRTELGMFGVMWSEHCCYRNSKPLLSKSIASDGLPQRLTIIFLGSSSK